MLDRLREYAPISNKMLVTMSGLRKKIENDRGNFESEATLFQVKQDFQTIHWNMSLLKQFSVYLFLVDSKGYSKLFSENDLAKLLNVSVRTIQNNNRTLTNAHLICWERRYLDIISFKFENYLLDIMDLRAKNSKLSQFELDALVEENPNGDNFFGGKGYTTLSKDFLIGLLDCKDINAVRFALRFVSAIEMNFSKAPDSKVYINRKFLDSIAKTYLNTKHRLADCLRLVKGFFELEILDTKEKIMGYVNQLNGPEYEKAGAALGGNMLVVVKYSGDNLPKVRREADAVELRNIAIETNEEVLDEYTKQAPFGFTPTKDILTLKRDEAVTLITTFGLKRIKDALKAVIQGFKDRNSEIMELLITQDAGLALRVMVEKN